MAVDETTKLTRPNDPLSPWPGYTRVIVITSNGMYIEKLISDADVMFRQYPESYGQLLGDELEKAFCEAHKQRKGNG